MERKAYQSLLLLAIWLGMVYFLIAGCGAKATDKGETFYLNPNGPPVLKIQGPSRVESGSQNSYILEISDPNNDSVSASLSASSGQLISITDKEYSYFAPLTAGTYLLTGIANDFKGGISTTTLAVQVDSGSANIDLTLSGLRTAVTGESEMTITVVLNTDSLKDLTYEWGSSGGQFRLVGGTSLFSTLVTTNSSVVWKAPANSGLHTITLIATAKTGEKRVYSESVEVVSTTGVTTISPVKPLENAAMVNLQPLTLQWTGGDDSSGSAMKYDIYFGTGSGPMTLIRQDVATTSKTVTITPSAPPTLIDPISGFQFAFLTQYRWQVVAKAANGRTLTSAYFIFWSAPDTLKTLYVDNRSTVVPQTGDPAAPYTTIQAALNALTAGVNAGRDTIFILGASTSPYNLSSSLTMPPTLNRAISITGVSRNAIAIRTNSLNFPVFDLTATSSVTLNRFTIKDFSADPTFPAMNLKGDAPFTVDSIDIIQSNSTPKLGMGILYRGPTTPLGSSLAVRATLVQRCGVGMQVQTLTSRLNNITVTQSGFSQNGLGVNFLTGSSTVTMSAVTVQGNDKGVCLTQLGTFNFGGYNIPTRVVNNQGHGVVFEPQGANRLSFARANFTALTIDTNGKVDPVAPVNVLRNTGHGIWFRGPSYGPATCTFAGCKVTNNFQNGLCFSNAKWLSVVMEGTKNDTKTENTIDANKWAGVVFESNTLTEVHAALFKNIITNNGFDGIIASNTCFVGKSWWIHNTIAFNASWGLNLNFSKNIYLEDSLVSTNGRGAIIENYGLKLGKKNYFYNTNAEARASDVNYLSLKYNVLHAQDLPAIPIFTDFNPDCTWGGKFGTETTALRTAKLNASTTFNLGFNIGTGVGVHFNIASNPDLIAASPFNLGGAADVSVRQSNFNGTLGVPGVPAGFNPGSGIRTGQVPELGAHGDDNR